MNQGRIHIETSKNGHPIPIINENYLHSSVDPIEEANIEIGQFEEKISRAKNILILGLGFGYHVDECQRIIRRNNKKTNICILEPNTELIHLYEEQRSEEHPYIFTEENIYQLFKDRRFLEFLLLKPTIIPHRASFKSNYPYFSKFLKHRSNDCIGSTNLMEGPKSLIQEHHISKTLDEATKEIISSNNISQSDFFLLLAKSFQPQDQKRI